MHCLLLYAPMVYLEWHPSEWQLQKVQRIEHVRKDFHNRILFEFSQKNSTLIAVLSLLILRDTCILFHKIKAMSKIKKNKKISVIISIVDRRLFRTEEKYRVHTTACPIPASLRGSASPSCPLSLSPLQLTQPDLRTAHMCFLKLPTSSPQPLFENNLQLREERRREKKKNTSGRWNCLVTQKKSHYWDKSPYSIP